MDEQDIDIPCPICSVSGTVKMIAHVDEIPYFGEHTQVTILCHDCGWRQTDFIPAEGKKAGAWTLRVDEPSKLTARVVRSSSCTVHIPELDLQVNPGSNATGYVSNIEGVLKRFKEIVVMVLRDLQGDLEENLEAGIDSETMDQIARLNQILQHMEGLDQDDASPLSIVLLDPHGHSMIMHPDAEERDLTPEELRELPVGPDPAVFSADEMA